MKSWVMEGVRRRNFVSRVEAALELKLWHKHYGRTHVLIVTVDVISE